MSKAEDGETDAAKRLALLRPYVDGEAPLTKVAATAGIPLRTARRWIARMREGGPAALGRKQRADAGDRRLDADLIGLVEGLALTRPRLSIATIHRRVGKVAAEKGLRPPSYASVHSIVNELDPATLTLAHEGEAAFRGYNVQLAVDTKHKLIAEQEVCNQVIDLGLLAPTVEAAMETLGVERIEAVADRGYFKIEDIEACEAAGITAYVPKPLRGPAVARGFFSKEAFRYDAEADTYTCPAGQTLRPRYYGKLRENVKVIYCDRKVCKGCGLRPSCTSKSYRGVTRLENEAVLDRMAARLEARPDILDLRRESVEHPFGTIKQWMNQGAFLMRRLDNVRGEFSLTALAYNIKRAITLVGIPSLIAAVKG